MPYRVYKVHRKNNVTGQKSVVMVRADSLAAAKKAALKYQPRGKKSHTFTKIEQGKLSRRQ